MWGVHVVHFTCARGKYNTCLTLTCDYLLVEVTSLAYFLDVDWSCQTELKKMPSKVSEIHLNLEVPLPGNALAAESFNHN